MNKNEFKKRLMNHLRKACSEYDSGLTYSSINNEAGHECISFRKRSDSITITIGIDSLFQIFRNEKEDFNILSDRIISYYDSFIGMAKNAAEGDIQMLQDNVYCRLINYNMNKLRLKNIPHEKKLDMAVVYTLRLHMSENENAGVILDYSKFVNRQNEDLIREAAWKNTLRDEPAAVCPLSELIDEESEMPIYVLSNMERYYGAICMYYPGLLKAIAKEMQEPELLIIPSSVHECLLLPADYFCDCMYIKDMVHQINRAELERSEILSDSVYIYDSKKDRISIDN